MLGWARAPTPAGTPTYVIDVSDWLRIVTPRDVPISADGFCVCAFAAIAAEQVAKRSATARRIHPPEEEGLALCTGGMSSGRQAEPRAAPCRPPRPPSGCPTLLPVRWP